jgi:sec-independent protein translocase protein TatA
MDEKEKAEKGDSAAEPVKRDLAAEVKAYEDQAATAAPRGESAPAADSSETGGKTA